MELITQFINDLANFRIIPVIFLILMKILAVLFQNVSRLPSKSALVSLR